MFRPGLLVLFALLGFAAAAPQAGQAAKPGTLVESTALGGYAAPQVRRAIGNFLARASDAPAPRFGVDRYRLRFVTSAPDGRRLETDALLYVPRLPAAAQVSVYAMASGTTGLADACATLAERPGVRNWGNYEAQMLSYAAQGFIAVLPDYAYYRDPARYQTYFIAAYNARAMLDSVRAVYRFFQGREGNARPAQRVFLAGYSQGAHTVFAATDIAARYAPDLRLAGATGFGTTVDVEALMRDSPYFTVYIMAAWRQHYGIDPRRVLQPRYAADLDAVAGRRCIDEIPRLYPNDARQLYLPAFREALFSGKLAAYYPELHRRLTENFSGLRAGAQSVPALIVQGGADPISPDRTVNNFVRRACGLGRSTEYLYLPGVHHFQVRQVGFRRVLDWMRSVEQGGKPSSCERFR